MPVDNRTRLNLHRTLEQTLGPEGADALMAHLPPVTWDQVATKDDLDHLRTNLRSEIHTATSDLRTEMQVGFADLRTEMAQATTRQIRWMTTFAAAWSTLLLAAVQLLP
ncbi:MAG: hypothetical protein CL424_16970 [Acidimicrobiaceae bacterium]|nr:hypothetical protein [Acidimicrobiaceae bacterium]